MNKLRATAVGIGVGLAVTWGLWENFGYVEEHSTTHVERASGCIAALGEQSLKAILSLCPTDFDGISTSQRTVIRYDYTSPNDPVSVATPTPQNYSSYEQSKDDATHEIILAVEDILGVLAGSVAGVRAARRPNTRQ